MQVDVSYGKQTGGQLNQVDKVVDKINTIQKYYRLNPKDDLCEDLLGDSINLEKVEYAQMGTPLIMVSQRPFENGDYVGSKGNYSIVSTSGWKKMHHAISLGTYIMFEACWALAAVTCNPDEAVLSHKSFCGCLFDNCNSPQKMLWVMRVGHLCHECEEKMKRDKVDVGAIDALNTILQYIRMEMLGFPNGMENKTKETKEQEIINNLRSFWDNNPDLVERYSRSLRKTPMVNHKTSVSLNERLKSCKTIIITANYVEGNRVTRLLMKLNGIQGIDRYYEDGQTYQVARLNESDIVHIWPRDTSSFTTYGAFRALSSAFKRFPQNQPERVISLGVAFGVDPTTQKIGDVLVARHIVPYDAFNKVTDGKITIKPIDKYETSVDLINRWNDFLGAEDQLEEEAIQEGISPFKWQCGDILSGASVLSDIDERERLIEAAKPYDVIGGEMEGHGVYFACEQKNIPCITIKGICDWGALKNGWQRIGLEGDALKYAKDCVQALAVDNAFLAMTFLLRQLSTQDGGSSAESVIKATSNLSLPKANAIKESVIIRLFTPYDVESSTWHSNLCRLLENQSTANVPIELRILLRSKHIADSKLSRKARTDMRKLLNSYNIKSITITFYDFAPKHVFAMLGTKLLVKPNGENGDAVTITPISKEKKKEIENHIKYFDGISEKSPKVVIE